MFRICRELRFCYGHRLLNYDGKCRYLHGHNGRVLITLAAERLDPLGMVVDFSHLKQRIGGWIDAHLDHKMILHRRDPLVPLLQAQGEPLYLLDDNPTAENLARLLYEVTAQQGFPVVEVRLWETADSCAIYRGPGAER